MVPLAPVTVVPVEELKNLLKDGRCIHVILVILVMSSQQPEDRINWLVCERQLSSLV